MVIVNSNDKIRWENYFNVVKVSSTYTILRKYLAEKWIKMVGFGLNIPNHPNIINKHLNVVWLILILSPYIVNILIFWDIQLEMPMKKVWIKSNCSVMIIMGTPHLHICRSKVKKWISVEYSDEDQINPVDLQLFRSQKAIFVHLLQDLYDNVDLGNR